jgi:hypothetical protein
MQLLGLMPKRGAQEQRSLGVEPPPKESERPWRNRSSAEVEEDYSARIQAILDRTRDVDVPEVEEEESVSVPFRVMPESVAALEPEPSPEPQDEVPEAVEEPEPEPEPVEELVPRRASIDDIRGSIVLTPSYREQYAARAAWG